MATAGSGWHAYLYFSESFSVRMEKSRQYKTTFHMKSAIKCFLT